MVKEMSIKITSGGMKVELSRFPDKTLKGELKNVPHMDNDIVVIRWDYEDDSELFALQCIVDTIREFVPDIKISLYMPYIPNARMDRVELLSEFFTLKTFAKIINSMNFNYVSVWDPHSNVSTALINRCHNSVWIEYIVSKICSDNNIDTIVLPDLGSTKRYDFTRIDTLKNVIVLDKIRDWKTGKITGMRVVSELPEQLPEKVMIMDDIISGGTTIAKCAECLNCIGIKDISVYATFLERKFYDSELAHSNLINKYYTLDNPLYIGNKGYKEVVL